MSEVSLRFYLYFSTTDTEWLIYIDTIQYRKIVNRASSERKM